MSSAQELLKQVKSQIVENTVDDVKAVVGARREGGPVIIDVREKEEWVEGHLPGARFIPRGFLEMRIEDAVPQRDKEVILYCAGGNRSALAARSLREMGYQNVKSMQGGYTAWKRAGLPVEKPSFLSAEQATRYARHVMLPEVGEAGQLKLLRSKVLCIGAGGLGSPAIYYLGAAGVGTIGVVDDDVVDESNLQRQILHSLARVGKPKIDSATEVMKGLNPDVRIVGHKTRISADNALEIVSQYDLVIDGADNFPTRYLLNDVCLKLGKPLVDASIYRFEGQCTVFMPGEGPCYRCLYPSPPPPDMAPSCQEAGVLGVLCGVVGSVQVNEAIKVLLGVGKPLVGRLLTYDALGMRWRELKLRRDPGCPTCGQGVDRSQIQLIDYEQFCRVT